MKYIRPISYFCLFFFCIVTLYYFIIHKPSISPIFQEPNQEQKMWETQLEHAQMLSYLHQYAEAELEYRKLLKLHPHSLPIRLNLARTLYYQSKNDEALNLLEQIPLHQRGEEVKVLLADIHLSLQHYNEAESLYREYLQQYPEDQTSQLNLAKVLSWQKKYEPSVEIYRHLLSNDPDNIQIRRQYGRVLIWMGKYSEGTEELKKTLIQEKNIP